MKYLAICVMMIPLLLSGQKIYLIGDAGEPKNPDKNLELLASKLADAKEEDVLLFLGDNLYPRGLVPKESEGRAEMEGKLIPQLELMKHFRGQSFMIPGNHDWAQGRNVGWAHALNMQDFVNEYLEREDAFLPLGACPGPIELSLNETATLIILNTQYFLHPWDKPDEDDFCENKSTAEALNELRSVIQKNRGKHIVIAAHHPVYTYGEHNGNFTFKEHIFPFRGINENLYLPMPLVGSIHPLFRKTIGNIQDNTHPKYKAIMKEIRSAMSEAEHVIFVSGHEHSLQLINKENLHFVVSGSGSKTTNLKEGKSIFGKSEKGFAIVDLDQEGSAEVSFWGAESGKLFESQLYTKTIELPQEELNNISFADSTVSIVASTKYLGGKGKNKWLGANYRDVWNTKVEIPVFDIGSEHGGLTVLKKGGGMQTKSLRMESKDGRQYVLRSIEKYPENAMPVALRKTFAQGIVQDQISSSHPYGAFVVPKLAGAVGIYHTNPRPVYIPDDPRLGAFRPIFSGMLAVYEERPNKEAAEDPWFGGGENVRGTDDVLAKLTKDNDNSVDQNFVVRNRLFDMWIGDWDRHDDQWRWVEFDKKEKGKRYRPIPRDRDQAFFINEGIIPKIASRKWALPKIEGFDETVRWAPGISQNARFFDRSFMNEPDWNDWQEQIVFLQENLTDEVIQEALAGWPEQIQKLTSERVSRGLKARRADLNRFAKEHYLYISEEVEVTGSDKHEYFEIERINEDETKVSVYKRKKDGDVADLLYQRIFKANETKEVRLYGLDGEDLFEVKGETKSKIRVRIIGGTDKDRVINSTGGKLGKFLVYDRKKSTVIDGNGAGISRLSEKSEVNAYNRKAFKYDILMPIALIQITPDDGIFYGGGFTYTKNAWRKEPYASNHSVLANFSGSTDSFSFKYSGDYTDAIGEWSFSPSIVWQEPFFVNNFFGIGNEQKFLQDQSVLPDDDDPIDYYRIRIKRFEADFDFTKKIGSKANFFIGPGYRSIEVEETPNRFISDILLPGEDFDRNNYFKFRAGINVDSRDSRILPQRGTTAKLEIEHFSAITNFSESFTRYSAEWAFFFSARLPSRLVIGNRIGAAHNEGDFEFFNANTLGGSANLRGYRRTRFYGETSFYHNLDLRLKLFSFRSYIFPGQFGILLFHDTGRVWVDDENSNRLHTGRGAGIWLSPLNSAVVSLNYSTGNDENLLSFKVGFFF